MEKKINISNLLITEFMGLKPVEYSGRYGISKDHCMCREDTAEKALEGFSSIAKYNTSWDWLMPCVKKINGQGYSSDGVRLLNNISLACGMAEIELAYKAVIEFINT